MRRDLSDAGGLEAGRVEPVETPGAPWPEPLPLSRSDTLSPFPLNTLPPWMRDFVEALSVFTQTPAEMGAICAVGAVATLCGGRVWVEVRKGWVEGTNIYAAICAAPGTRKSPVHDATTAPLREYEWSRINQQRPEIAKDKARREVLEAKRARLKGALEKAKGTMYVGLEADLEDATAELAAMDPLHEFRLLVGDTTPERLIELLAEQGGRLAILSDEDTVLGHLLGRYSKRPMIEPFLSAYSNKPIDMDRRSKTPIRVRRPALTIVTALQPNLLENARGDAMVVGRGVLDRFAFILPRNLIGLRDMEPPTISDDVREGYRAELLRIAEDVQGDELMLRFNDRAAVRFAKWLRELERRRGAAGDLAVVQGWASKADGLTARLAGLLHIAEGGRDAPIEERTVEAAITLTNSLAEHAIAAADTLGTNPEVASARAVLSWTQEQDLTAFRTRDAHTALRSRFPKVEDIRGALHLLAEHHLVRKLPPRTGAKGGRPSEAWEVSPRLQGVLCKPPRFCVRPDPGSEGVDPAPGANGGNRA